MVLLSAAERAFIANGCRDDCRGDGRVRDQVRGYALTLGEIPMSHGSASLRVGSELHILCSIKADVVAPSQAKPSSGVVEDVHVMFMGSDGSNSGGGRSKGTMSPDRVLGAALTRLLCDHILIEDSAAALCIMSSQLVWRLHADIVIAYGGDTAGSLLDWCSTVMVAALCDTRLPGVDVVMNESSAVDGTGSVKGKDAPSWQVQPDMALASLIPGMDRAPTIVTVTLVSCDGSSYLLLDATATEAACSSAQVHVSVSSGPRSSNDEEDEEEPVICAIDMSGGASLPFKYLPDVTSLALGEAYDQQRRLHEAIESASSGLSDAQYQHPHMLQERFEIQ